MTCFEQTTFSAKIMRELSVLYKTDFHGFEENGLEKMDILRLVLRCIDEEKYEELERSHCLSVLRMSVIPDMATLMHELIINPAYQIDQANYKDDPLYLTLFTLVDQELSGTCQSKTAWIVKYIGGEVCKLTGLKLDTRTLEKALWTRKYAKIGRAHV